MVPQDKMFRYPPSNGGRGPKGGRCKRGGGPLPPTPYLGGKLRKGKHLKAGSIGAVLAALGPIAKEILPHAVKGVKWIIDKIKKKRLAKSLAKNAKRVLANNPKMSNELKETGKKLLNKGVDYVKGKVGPNLAQQGQDLYKTARDEYYKANTPTPVEDVTNSVKPSPAAKAGALRGNYSIKQKANSPHAYLANTMNKIRTKRLMIPRPQAGIKFDGGPKGGQMKGPIP